MLLSWCLSTATQGEAGGMQRTGNRPTTTRENGLPQERDTLRVESRVRRERQKREREGDGDGGGDTEGKVRLLERGGRGEKEKSETSEGGQRQGRVRNRKRMKEMAPPSSYLKIIF